MSGNFKLWFIVVSTKEFQRENLMCGTWTWEGLRLNRSTFWIAYRVDFNTERHVCLDIDFSESTVRQLYDSVRVFRIATDIYNTTVEQNMCSTCGKRITWRLQIFRKSQTPRTRVVWNLWLTRKIRGAYLSRILDVCVCERNVKVEATLDKIEGSLHGAREHLRYVSLMSYRATTLGTLRL